MRWFPFLFLSLQQLFNVGEQQIGGCIVVYQDYSSYIWLHDMKHGIAVEPSVWGPVYQH